MCDERDGCGHDRQLRERPREPVVATRGGGNHAVPLRRKETRTARRPTWSTTSSAPGVTRALMSPTFSLLTRTPPCWILRVASLVEAARPAATTSFATVIESSAT